MKLLSSTTAAPAMGSHTMLAPVKPVLPKVRGETCEPMNLLWASSQPRAVQAPAAAVPAGQNIPASAAVPG